MPHSEHSRLLAQTLMSFGLDLGRYTPALADAFLQSWPNIADWTSGAAQAALISTFAIGETTFLRHPEQFAAAQKLAAQLRAARGGAPLRAFSAGCASGEEAYSMAATLGADGPLQLIAWDINPEAIDRAREGRYRPWSLRGVEVENTAGWLEPSPCGVRVRDGIRHAIDFRVGNLCSDPFPTDLDLIFCRNVLLYFRPELAAHVITRLAQALRPGGVLFLGHYDPRPMTGAPLAAESLDGVTFYRRRGEGVVLSPAPARLLSSPPPPSGPLACRRTVAPRRTQAKEEAILDQMRLIRVKANQRRTEEALILLDRLSREQPMRPEVHVLTALVAEEAGDPQHMLTAARRACFLVPEQAGPNYFLSVAFLRNGELHRAALHRRVAATSLRRAPQSSLVLDYSEGLTVGQLRRLIGAIGH